jgi:hypothetical protein
LNKNINKLAKKDVYMSPININLFVGTFHADFMGLNKISFDPTACFANLDYKLPSKEEQKKFIEADETKQYFSGPGLELFPHNILAEIFKYLTVKDYQATSQVCKRFYQVCQELFVMREVFIPKVSFLSPSSFSQAEQIQIFVNRIKQEFAALQQQELPIRASVDQLCKGTANEPGGLIKKASDLSREITPIKDKEKLSNANELDKSIKKFIEEIKKFIEMVPVDVNFQTLLLRTYIAKVDESYTIESAKILSRSCQSPAISPQPLSAVNSDYEEHLPAEKSLQNIQSFVKNVNKIVASLIVAKEALAGSNFNGDESSIDPNSALGRINKNKQGRVGYYNDQQKFTQLIQNTEKIKSLSQ